MLHQHLALLVLHLLQLLDGGLRGRPRLLKLPLVLRLEALLLGAVTLLLGLLELFGERVENTYQIGVSLFLKVFFVSLC